MPQNLLEELSKAASAESEDAFAEALLQGWSQVVAADFYSLIRHNEASQSNDFWSPGEGRLLPDHRLPRLFAKLLALEEETVPHPNRVAFLSLGPGAYLRSMQMSDLEWRQTVNYRYLDRPSGISDMLCLYLPPLKGTLVTIHAGSRHSNFDPSVLESSGRFAALAGALVAARSGFVRQNPLPLPNLTKREFDILHWVAEGKRNMEIAVILGISKHTVRNHLENVFAKLGVETRTAAGRMLAEIRKSCHREG